MKLNLRRLALCAVYALALPAWANAENQPPLLLTNHTVSLSGVKSVGELPHFDGYYYFILQGNISSLNADLPAGLEYLEYLPKNAGLYRASHDRLENLLPQLQKNYTVGALKGEWKLSKRLFSGNIPEWAWIENKDVYVWVRSYQGVSQLKASAMLKAQGYTILEIKSDENLIALRCNVDDIRTLASLPFVMQLQEREDPGTPENWTARTSHRVNTIQNQDRNKDYDGSGVVLSLGDDGAIGPHIDYQGRLNQSSAGASNGDHGDHVAGTIFGAGNLDPLGMGMAPGLDMVYYSYPGNLNAADNDYSSNSVRLTSSSYSNGCNAGYTNFTRQMDQDYIDNPNLIHVFSAGNSGTSNCNYGAGAGWGNVTGGHKIAKNVVAVANLTRLDALAGSSSRGPASDGRIKPDVGAVGTSVFSTTDPNSYTLKTGTSMACPGVSGTLATLMQAFKENNNGAEPNSALLRGILLNSADDLGNPGPDFRFGYGRINARRATEDIENSRYFSGSLTSSGTASHTITIPANTAEVKVMLVWGDLPASTIANRALVNDLDMTITSGGNTLLPLVLDPTPVVSNLNANAVPARDSLNNQEQIVIANPTAGDITVNVSAFNIPNGSQSYYVVYSISPNVLELTHPVGGEKFVPGTSEILRWDAPEATGSFQLEYSTDNGANWNNISSNVNSNLRHFTWTVPNTISSQALVRIRRATQSDQSDGNFTIIGTPTNISFPSACPDTLLVQWTPVPSAQGYVIYRLGTKYMDSIGYTTNSFYRAAIPSTGEEWISVAAVANGGGIGLRALAKERPQGVFNCQLDDDLAVETILSPANGNLPNCFNFTNIPVRARLINQGTDSIFSFVVGYSFNSGTAVSSTINDTLAPGESYLYTSSGTLSLSAGNINRLKLWALATADQNPYNDTLLSTTQIYNGSTVSLPYVDSLETSVPQCNTQSNCGATSCVLSAGLFNLNNGLWDDIDWRGNSGTTPSSNTGPTRDHRPGTSSGRYLYTEASACFNQTAILHLPCVNLGTAVNPVFRFYRHMSGTDMGSLSVDVFDGSEWTLDVASVSGDQGPAWQMEEVDLTPFAGQLVLIRIRATTGSNFTSDIAIDDFEIFENSRVPAASFNASATTTCINGSVLFADNSSNFPTSYLWRVQPSATAQFVANDSISDSVRVRFTAAGSYTVSLIVSNQNGTDTLTRTALVTASAGAPLSTFQGFDGGFVPADWEVVNPDNLTAWSIAQVTGAQGSASNTVLFDHTVNPINNSRDFLVGNNTDLTNQNNAQLLFDVAYAENLTGAFDSLVVVVSTDCGETFTRTSYAKSGSQLATSAPVSGRFVPSSALDWRTDTVDLSGFSGTNVRVAFLTVSGRGNAVYLDNIQVVNANVTAPTASIINNNAQFCVGDSATFEAANPVSGASYTWDFGSLAVPNTATGPGPHKVLYLSNSPAQTVQLTASNAGGRKTDFAQFSVARTAVALNNYTTTGLQVDFNDLSLYSPTAWLWYFGDGDSSTMQNPVHTYAAGGTYTVQQFASNDCGGTDRSFTVTVSGIGLEEAGNILGLGLYPNPTNANSTLQVDMAAGEQSELFIYDLSGKLLFSHQYQLVSGQNTLEIPSGNFASGAYIVRLRGESGQSSIRLLKN